MKNIFILFALFFTVSVSAQTFTPVDSVKQSNDAEFVAFVDGNRFSISAREFVDFQQEKHFLVEFIGKNSFKIFISEKEFKDEYLTVENVGLVSDSVIVMFDNKTSYKTPIKKWLDVQKGQVVKHIKISSSKRNFERYFTVDEKDNIIDKSTGMIKKGKTGEPAKMPEKPEITTNNIILNPLPEQTIDVGTTSDTLVTESNNDVVEDFNLKNFRLIQK